MQRVESGKIDPTIVNFERYAFDLSRFNVGPRLGALGVRERNLWDVAFPDADDPTLKQNPNGFRAEFHDRLAAPIYPIAFTVLCFAILGAPRTSRQSREISIIMTVVLIGALRLTGFACNVLAAQTVAAVYILWGSITLTFVVGAYMIANGVVLEPPAFLTNLSNQVEKLKLRLQPA